MSERNSNCTIAVDVMGSDKGPTEFVRALVYLKSQESLHSDLILVGRKKLIERMIAVKDRYLQKERLEILDASEVISMDEKPIAALKQKKDSSMLKAIELVKSKRADAMVSCGNTGAMMAGGTLRLRPIEGVERPALAAIIPSKKDPFIFLDVGANPESDPKHLVHNAILGSHYARARLGIQSPRVGLLTIGTEQGKGTATIAKTHSYLSQLSESINYTGLIEGFQLFDGDIDVVVCDGFVGNILLKSSESLFSLIGETIKKELLRNIKRKIGAALSASAFKNMKAQLNPDERSGAPLLGLNGHIIKSHGSSNAVAIASSIIAAQTVVECDRIDTIKSDILLANQKIEAHSND
ncbi:MAG: phosphate acyltransferase PlsX [Puniceicoccaceae bacterium]|nr:phosphate acyltransferase PlsX [Puniceicoccaceae bacterium]